jgi:hypothetical protein
MITPPIPTAQLFESLTMYTELKTQAQGPPTAFPVQVFPSYHIDTGAGPYVGVPPTAHPVDPLERYTPSRNEGFTAG